MCPHDMVLNHMRMWGVTWYGVTCAFHNSLCRLPQAEQAGLEVALWVCTRWEHCLSCQVFPQTLQDSVGVVSQLGCFFFYHPTPCRSDISSVVKQPTQKDLSTKHWCVGWVCANKPHWSWWTRQVINLLSHVAWRLLMFVLPSEISLFTEVTFFQWHMRKKLSHCPR
jgi:hypothetical protein